MGDVTDTSEAGAVMLRALQEIQLEARHLPRNDRMLTIERTAREAIKAACSGETVETETYTFGVPSRLVNQALERIEAGLCRPEGEAHGTGD